LKKDRDHHSDYQDRKFKVIDTTRKTASLGFRL